MPALEKHTWRQARASVQSVNPELAAIIDELDPSDDYTLYKATYPYGSQILKQGEFSLPTEKGLVPFNDPSIDSSIQDDLAYNSKTNPVTLVLEKSLEMFVTLEDRVVPFSLFQPGDMFGLSYVLADPADRFSHESIFIWDLTAGARSIFMMPKVSESNAHSRLTQAFDTYVDKPKTHLDHWQVFRAIAQHENFIEPWDVQLLFFSKKWFEKLNDPAWMKLRLYLLNTAWKSTEFWRNQFTWNLTFRRIQSLRHIKASSYIADVAKHVLAIGTMAIPGFRPATDSSLAPIKGIQDAYLNRYDLKPYHPIVMQPAMLASAQDRNPVYYSLQFPSALELSPKTSERSSTISDLYDVRALLVKYLKAILESDLNIESTPLYELARSIDLKYYHSNVDLYVGMRPSEDLPKDDRNFSSIVKAFDDREFPKNSAFVKGAIGISLTR